MKRFENRCVIVTGGVSGIVEGIGPPLAAEGAKPVLNCLPGEAAGPKVLESLKSQGADCILVEADISDQPSVERLVEEAKKAYGKIHTFVSNAAAFDYYKPLLDTPLEVWDKVCAVNLRGNYFIARAVLPHMLENGVPAQNARDVLPTCTAAKLFVTANFREWRHILQLRLARGAHPKIRVLAKEIWQKLTPCCPVYFADLEKEFEDL